MPNKQLLSAHSYLPSLESPSIRPGSRDRPTAPHPCECEARDWVGEAVGAEPATHPTSSVEQRGGSTHDRQAERTSSSPEEAGSVRVEAACWVG